MSAEKATALPSIADLLQQIQLDIGVNVELYIIMAFMAAMLTIHGVAVLIIASAFHTIDRFLKTIPHLAGGSFISYFIAILLIILTHITEIVAWTYVLVALAVFPGVTQTFYFVGEMYTTLGFGNYPLGNGWQILPILISFSGVFAVSMSGAALYSMMGALLTRKSGSVAPSA
jgi:hypothetical protein